MKMTLLAINNHYENLLTFGNIVLPASVSYAISVNLNRFRNELDHVTKEQIKIYERYADKDENGTIKKELKDGKITYSFTNPENRTTVQSELAALYDTEEDVDVRTVDLNALLLMDQDKEHRYGRLTVNHMEKLSFMIEES